MNILDRIIEATQATPYLGAESEGGVIDPNTFETHHDIGGRQPTEAVKEWLRANLTRGEAGEIEPFITPDVPETITEVNPPPLRSPRSTAMAQRLYSILVDSVQQILGNQTGQNIQLIHGVALRPPNITEADASEHIDPFKRLYYQFQIKRHGDRVGAAFGDHYNLSAPWKTYASPAEASDFYIRMAGRMRLVGAALMMGLGTASPLYYASQNGKVGTTLTGLNSNRLGHVWPGRTIMDTADLFRSRPAFLSGMYQFLDSRLLYTGRDIWLPVRPQAAPIHSIKSFQEICNDCGIDLSTPGGKEQAKKILVESFSCQEGDPRSNTSFAPIKGWRLDMVRRFIDAPRNRVEMRVDETPPAFEDQTPYEYIVALHAFQEVLFIYLTLNPEWAQQLSYNSLELQAAKNNEYSILNNGLDAEIYWPHNCRETTGRQMLLTLLEDNEFQEIVTALGRQEELEIIQRIARGSLKPPAERMRDEIAQAYGIRPDRSQIDRFLHGENPDRYPRELLARTRAAMAHELVQIENDLPKTPSADQEFLGELLKTAKAVRARITPAI